MTSVSLIIGFSVTEGMLGTTIWGTTSLEQPISRNKRR
jgi:hypothetical protein